MLFTVIGGKFKFQVQDSDLEYIFLEIWRFEKHIAFSEKDTFTFNAVVVVTSTQIFYVHTACDM